MRRPVILSLALTAVLAAMLVGCGKKSAKVQFVTMGTGSQTGVYFPTGVNIAKYVNDKKDLYNIDCTVESTGGSEYNTRALLSGEMDFGIVQSDIQYNAYKGLGSWEKDGPQTSLRAVFSIHPEMVNLVAAVDSGITSLADLKGKVVNLGAPGSGDRVNAIAALKTAGLDPEKDIDARYLEVKQAPGLLQDGRIDAFFFTVGHPAGAIQEATTGGVSARKVCFVPITNVDALIKENPYFSKSAIPISYYPNAANKEDVPTFAVKATLLSTTAVADDVVYAFAKEVMENFEAFKKLHPAYSTITKESMLEGLSAPLHPGAERYYREVGLLK